MSELNKLHNAHLLMIIPYKKSTALKYMYENLPYQKLVANKKIKPH